MEYFVINNIFASILYSLFFFNRKKRNVTFERERYLSIFFLLCFIIFTSTNNVLYMSSMYRPHIYLYIYKLNWFLLEPGSLSLLLFRDMECVCVCVCVLLHNNQTVPIHRWC